MKKIPCYCDNIIEINFPEEINLADKPELYSSILNGTFMNFTCSNCGKILKPEFPLHLIDPDKNLDIFFIPELDRSLYLKGELSYSANRIVIGYQELVEKIMIINNELDDRVIEIIKFYLFEKADNNDAAILFKEISDNNLVFHIHGLKENEVGIINIPLDFYQKVKKDIKIKEKEEPFSNILSPPYISINKITREVL